MKESAPKSDGITASGIWLTFCVVMIFGAMAEYGIILFLMLRYSVTANRANVIPVATDGLGSVCQFRRPKVRGNEQTSPKCTTTIKDNQLEKYTLGTSKQSIKGQSGVEHWEYRNLDVISMMLFPVVFFTFVIIYVFVFCHNAE